MKHIATWELKNMIKALSMMSVLNTDTENKRLEQAKQELKARSRNYDD
tara:strand:- start:1209 stop:1352 length:144 start_codon:yes stop_codon:yes gene_type:complete